MNTAATPDLSQASYGTLLRLLWKHVSPRRRWQLGLLVALMLLSSLAELLTVASLVPFLLVLADPASLWRQPWVRSSAEALGVSTPEQLILPITLLLMAAGVLSAAIRAANLFVNARLSALIGSDLGVEAFRRTLEQPYAVHLGRNSSEVITRLSYLGLISRGVLGPLLQGFSGLIVAAVLVIGFFVYQPHIALGLTVVFLLAYISISRANRRRLNQLSSLADRYSKRSLRAQQESLAAIRDVLLDRSQPLVLEDFRRSERPLRLLEAEADTLSGLPRFVLEAIGMVVITGSSFYLLSRGGVSEAIPVLGAIALGFQRLLPAVQQIYGASTYLGAYRARLAAGLELLEQDRASAMANTGYALIERAADLPFNNEILCRNIEFFHDPERCILKTISLTIKCGQWIGLVGATGSGKSSLLDCLLGLLSPVKGDIFVDGLALLDREQKLDRRPAWQKQLAHVPQAIFLADATIAENIALGVAADQIDHERVAWAAGLAQANDFIHSLPGRYQTRVGERGVRLSGGQRQRLGIARALYKQSAVLILDEATSALDRQTEEAVTDALWYSCKNLTVIMVAHRLTTLSRCQQIFELQAGDIKAIHSYEQLMALYQA